MLFFQFRFQIFFMINVRQRGTFSQCSFMKIEKIDAKSIFLQKIQKSLCITTKSLYTNSNFKRNYLENYNDSEVVVKTKNALFFMNFPNI